MVILSSALGIAGTPVARPFFILHGSELAQRSGTHRASRYKGREERGDIKRVSVSTQSRRVGDRFSCRGTSPYVVGDRMSTNICRFSAWNSGSARGGGSHSVSNGQPVPLEKNEKELFVLSLGKQAAIDI